jgi:magnesium chelatase family protein
MASPKQPLKTNLFAWLNMKNMFDSVYPCPCRWLNDPQKACGCAPTVTKYQKQISGLLLDRIDIHIEAPHVDSEKLSGNRMGKTSESMRKCV